MGQATVCECVSCNPNRQSAGHPAAVQGSYLCYECRMNETCLRANRVEDRVVTVDVADD